MPTLTKQQPKGLIDRKGSPGASYVSAGGVVGYVVNVNWIDLQPLTTYLGSTDPIVLSTQPLSNTGPITNAINWARANPGTWVKLRIYCGINAPSWAVAIADGAATQTFPSGIPMQDQNSNLNGNGPSWWTPTYQTANRNFMAQMAATYDQEPVILDMAMGGDMTVYAENCLRQITDGSQPNTSNYASINFPQWADTPLAGYTRDKDLSALAAMVSNGHAAGFLSTYLSLSLNPYQAAPFYDIGTVGTDGSIAGSVLTATNSGRWTGLNHFGSTDTWPADGSKHTGALNLATAIYFPASNRAYKVNTNTNNTITVASPDGTNVTDPTIVSTNSFHNETGRWVIVATSPGDGVFTQYLETVMKSGFAVPGGHSNLGVIGNNSIRATLQTATYEAMYNDFLAAAGALGQIIYFQTAQAGLINGSSSTTLTPMQDTLQRAVNFGASYVELPAGYDSLKAFSTTGNPTNSQITGTSLGGTNTWGAGAGKYGKLTFSTSGNSYFVSASTSTTLTLVGVAGQPGTLGTGILATADRGAGKNATVYKWCYLSPSECATWTNRLAANATPPAGHFANTPPVITGITPNTGVIGGGTVVTVSGSNLLGVTAVNFGATPGTGLVVNSDSSVTVTSPAHAAGVVDITAVNVNGTSATGGADRYTFGSVGAPTVTAVSPATGPPSGGTPVTITGTNFANVGIVSFGAAVVSSFNVVSTTTITTTAPAHVAGAVDVRVTNTTAQSAITGADVFTYAAPAAPTINSVSPAVGPTAGGITVTLTGTGFTGATATIGGSAVAVTIPNDTTLSFVTPAHAAGAVDIAVTTAGGTATSVGGFTYQAAIPAPTVTGVTPSTGFIQGGGSLTITGTTLTGATAVMFGAVAAIDFTVINPTTIVVNTIPAGAAGVVDITVTTPSGTSATSSADHYTYTTPPTPTVATVSPIFGSYLGGTVVTVTGTLLDTVTAVTFGGVAATFTRISPTQLTAVAPPHGGGSADVQVTGPTGTSPASSGDLFTYLVPPPPDSNLTMAVAAYPILEMSVEPPMKDFLQGKTVVVRINFRDPDNADNANNFVDPDVVQATVQFGQRSASVYTYGASGELTRVDQGRYRLRLVLTNAGVCSVLGKGIGNWNDVDSLLLNVTPTRQ